MGLWLPRTASPERHRGDRGSSNPSPVSFALHSPLEPGLANARLRRVPGGPGQPLRSAARGGGGAPPKGDIDHVRELLSEVLFLSAMQTLAVLASGVFHARMSPDSHRRLAARFYPEPIRRKVLDFIDGREKRFAFDPARLRRSRGL